MKKQMLSLLLAFALCLSACSEYKNSSVENAPSPVENPAPVEESSVEKQFEGTVITLDDSRILVDGNEVSTDESSAVYASHDIIYYEAGKDFTYGEGEKDDEHSAEEAAAHTVVHITKPGNYSLNGTLSAGQIAIDLGEDAEENPEAVVNLYLDNVEISCSVAPAVIFYNVYECGSTEEADAKADVDTSAAGANVYLADGSINTVNGSYVARIYKSVELSEDGKTVVDSKKLHKYDAAFYSKQSMNFYGNDGILNIKAENEGLDSELHLTLNGGIINIDSGNDGINTNEDNISVTTINGGKLNISVNGSTGEGDGIDSNGWLVINGGEVTAAACSFSADSGIDADMGIQINGGTVLASGNMLDRIDDNGQTYMTLSFAETQKGGSTYSLKDASGNVIAELTPANDFSSLVFSSAELTEGNYTLWNGDAQLSYRGSDFGFGFGGMRPEFGTPPEGFPADGKQPELPEGMETPKDDNFKGEKFDFSKNEDGSITLPDGTTIQPEDFKDQRPNDGKNPGVERPNRAENDTETTEASTDFTIVTGSNQFGRISAITESD